MVTMAMQLTAESTNNDENQTSRELEASVLNKAAALLADVQGHWQEDKDKAYLAEVLRYNQRLWNVFRAEVAENAGRLPDEVRQNVISLSNFIGKQTSAVMADPAPEKLDILIKINKGLAEGLQMH